MSIQSDRWISGQATQHRTVKPLSEQQAHEGDLSLGLSLHGNDIRFFGEFKNSTHLKSAILDFKACDDRSFIGAQANPGILPPSSLALAQFIEPFRTPEHVPTICVGRSTERRSGNTSERNASRAGAEGIREPRGRECRHATGPGKCQQGLCQILFFRSDEARAISFADCKADFKKHRGIMVPTL